jgi:hypothetical protein
MLFRKSYLEKACEIDPERRRNGLRNYYLGLSDIKIGSQKAFESLSIAYHALHERASEDNVFLKEFIHLSNAYVEFLAGNGEKHLANKIIERTNLLLISKGYEVDHSRKQIRQIVENREPEV